MINDLDFLNKNIERSYPIQQGATKLSNNGLLLNNYVIAAISLSIPAFSNVLDYQPFISQVSLSNNILTVSVAVLHKHSSFNLTIPIGFFSAVITSDFQVLNLTNVDGYSSGFLISGQADVILSTNGILDFSLPNQSGLEISTYVVFNPPGVKNLNYREQTLTGNINFGALTNLIETNVGNSCELAVIDNSDILSIADLNSQFRNCPTPEILTINKEVVPYPIDDYADDANIYLFGIDPVIFYGDSVNSSINATTIDLDLSSFCTLNQTSLAPVDPNYLVNRNSDFIGEEEYYSKSQTPVVNFLFETNPEYLSWPYVTIFTLTQASPTTGSYTIINPAGINGVISKIYALIDTGSATFTVKIDSVNVTGLTSLVVANTGSFTSGGNIYTANSLVALATGANAFTNTSNIQLAISGVTGTPASLQLVVFYTQTF
jgi:hypothetical protein